MKKTFSLIFVFVAAVLFVYGCSSTKEVETLSAEERFAQAMRLFNNGDYLEAIEEFKIVTVQFPGSRVADNAQFHIGECRFRRDEYILAGAEYDMLVRTMPSSPLVPKARYMKAMSDYNLSPRSELDQKYTRDAIDDFQTFIEYSPTDSLAKDAEARINELNNKLAKKDLDNGKLYYKMEFYKAAIAYFDNVLDRYHDTEYADDALFGKARAMRERKDYAGALDAISLFFQKYPTSNLTQEVEELRAAVQNDISQQKTAPKRTPGLSTKSD